MRSNEGRRGPSMPATMSMILFNAGNSKTRVGHKRSLLLAPETEVEVQLKSWASAWDEHVFHDKLPAADHPCFIYNKLQYNKILNLVEAYHNTSSSEQIGKDRFVWTCFAGAIIKEHQRQLERRQIPQCYWEGDKKCDLHGCFYVLLWISFHLRLPTTDMVKKLIAELVSCTRSLKFLFIYLPSISLRLFSRLVWSGSDDFVGKMCWEFFSLFDSDMVARPAYKEAFELFQPMLLYLVQHLTPLHSPELTCKKRSGLILVDMVNRRIISGKKISLLLLAVRHHDVELIKLLIDRGASADRHFYDAYTETSISAEKLMISSINAIMGSQQFFVGFSEGLMKLIDNTVDNISVYAPLFRRSVMQSAQRKASDVWRDKDSTFELNREIADKWGIDCKRPFPLLQHMCKICIRHQILRADKALLSVAAQELPLPKKLVRYINLQLD